MLLLLQQRCASGKVRVKRCKISSISMTDTKDDCSLDKALHLIDIAYHLIYSLVLGFEAQ